MHEPNFALDNDREQINESFDVRPPSKPGIEFTSSQRTVACAIEHRAELILVEQRSQPPVIFGITGSNAFPRQRPVIFLANRDDLSWITRAKIVECVVTGDAGHTGNKQGQGDRLVGAGDHGTNCTQWPNGVSYQPAARRRATNAA